MDNHMDLNTIPEIPHGHGLSFKKGVSDGLLGKDYFSGCFHETHNVSYEKGKAFGEYLKILISHHVQG